MSNVVETQQVSGGQWGIYAGFDVDGGPVRESNSCWSVAFFEVVRAGDGGHRSVRWEYLVEVFFMLQDCV